MAGNMRVSILLDFIKKGAGAREARNDLKGLKQEAQGLKGVGGADRLNRSLDATSAKARKAAHDLGRAKTEARALAVTEARGGALNRLKDMARPKERAADMMRASASGALAAGAGGLGLAGVAGGGVLAGLAFKGVSAGLNLERAMFDVSRATDASGKVLDEYQRKIVQLSLATGKAAPELASMLAAAGFAGRPKDELMDFTRYAGQAMTAWGTNAEDTGQALAEIGTIYQANQKRIEEIGDAINTAADQSASKETDLLDTLKRVGAAGRMIRVSAEQTLAFGAALREAGTQPAVVGTALQALFTNMAVGDGATKDFADGLKAVGTNAKQLQKNVRKDATGAIVDLLKRIKQVPDKLKQMEILKNLFGREYADNMGALLNNLPGLERMIALLTDKKNYVGSVSRDATKRLQTDFNRLERAQESLSELARRVGEPLKIAAGSLAEGINSLLKAYDDLKDAKLKVEEAAKRIADGEARPGDVETIANDPDGAEKVREAIRAKALAGLRQNYEAAEKQADLASPDEAVDIKLRQERENLERERDRLKDELKGGVAGKANKRMRLAQIERSLLSLPQPTSSIDPRRPADVWGRTEDGRKETDARIVEERKRANDLGRLKVLEDMLPEGTARAQVRGQRDILENGYGPPMPPGTPSNVPAPPVRPADLRAQFEVDLQPAAESMMLKYATGISGAQGAAEGAAGQVGDGVRNKLSSVDAAAAGQQAMASFAQGLAAGGEQAVAAAQQVAARVRSALTVNVASAAGGGGVRSIKSGSLHDGVT